ncbi:MAG TPA: hypothetical protein VK569_06570, partial [Bacteroidota bacterium]|nr:hypothetical protein [Bacteroidota bacterium]
MNLRRTLRVAGAAAGISLAFVAVYSLSPFSDSPGSGAFLRGLARGGFGALRADWLAGTADPSPLFSFLVYATYRKLSPALFTLYQAGLMGVYAISLLSIGRTAGAVVTPAARRIFVLLFLFIHASALALVTIRFTGVDVRDLLTGGIGGTALPGSAPGPGAFGVFLIAAVALFMHRHEYAATALAALAACIDPRYMMVAAALVIVCVGILARERSGAGKTAAAGALPVALLVAGGIYWCRLFKPDSLHEAMIALGFLRAGELPFLPSEGSDITIASVKFLI